MLVIEVPIGEKEMYNEAKQEFFFEGFRLELEHSLASLSKWESDFEKSFLSQQPKTSDEMMAYLKAMCLTPNVPDKVFEKLTQKNVDDISDYINRKMTATWFSEENSVPTREIITAELIYFWMVALNIPFECQYWHLNKLLTLVRVCNEKNKPQKELTVRQVAERNRALNAARKKQFNTEG